MKFTKKAPPRKVVTRQPRNEPQLGIWMWCGSCHRCYRRGEEHRGRCPYRDCAVLLTDAKPWRSMQASYTTWPSDPLPGTLYSPPGQTPLTGTDAPAAQP